MMIKRLALLAMTFVTTTEVVAETTQAPTLQLNGYTSVLAAGAFQGNNSNGQGGAQHLAIGSSNIYFTAKGMSAGGLQYKYRAALESYPGGKSTSGSPIYFTQNYIEFAHNNMGIIQGGNLSGPEDTMRESGLNLIGGSAGIDGTFGDITNKAEGVISGVHQAGQTSKATKLVCYTPSLNGITLGISYTPNTTRMGTDPRDNSGNSVSNTYGNESGIYPDKPSAAFGMSNVAVGINYKADFKTWNMALALIGVAEDTKRGANNSTFTNSANSEFFRYLPANKGRSAQISAAIGFDKWRFATGAIFNGKSRLPKSPTYSSGDAGRAFNFAGQYTVGAYQFAIGYFKTLRQLPKIPGATVGATTYGNVTGNATSDIVTATVDFNALQGLKFFGEIDVFNYKTDKNYAKFIGTTSKYTSKNISPVTDNAGTAVIVGTKLSF